jgi:hypothetical protein
MAKVILTSKELECLEINDLILFIFLELGAFNL